MEASYPAIWRFCAALTDVGAADDLTQEALLRATRGLPRFRGQASQTTWLLSIARNVCTDHIRTRYRDRDMRAEQDLSAGSHDLADSAVAQDLLSRLEPERRAAFFLTQLFGLTYQEAAQVCDCPTGTIRSRVARAREDLIELIAEPQLERAGRVGSDLPGARERDA